MDHKVADRPLIVYGHDFCSQAGALAESLAQHGIEHEWRDVMRGDPQWKEELRALARGNLSVPTVLFPDGTVMVEPYSERVLEKLGVAPTGLGARIRSLFS